MRFEYLFSKIMNMRLLQHWPLEEESALVQMLALELEEESELVEMLAQEQEFRLLPD